MKELLDNAVLSIELGVEDYQTGDERRVLSANLLLWMPLGLQGFSERLNM